MEEYRNQNDHGRLHSKLSDLQKKGKHYCIQRTALLGGMIELRFHQTQSIKGYGNSGGRNGREHLPVHHTLLHLNGQGRHNGRREDGLGSSCIEDMLRHYILGIVVTDRSPLRVVTRKYYMIRRL